MATITDETIAAIKAGLEGVTPGPWAVTRYGPTARMVRVAGGKPIAEICLSWTDREIAATASHIARLGPDTVAALIERLERAEADNARLREALDEAANKQMTMAHKYNESVDKFMPHIGGIGGQMSNIIRRSDCARSLRRLAKAVDAIVGKMDRDAVADHAKKLPGSQGPTPHYTAARTRDLIDALNEAKEVIEAMK